MMLSSYIVFALALLVIGCFTALHILLKRYEREIMMRQHAEAEVAMLKAANRVNEQVKTAVAQVGKAEADQRQIEESKIGNHVLTQFEGTE